MYMVKDIICLMSIQNGKQTKLKHNILHKYNFTPKGLPYEKGGDARHLA